MTTNNTNPISPWRRGPTPAGLSIYGAIHPSSQHDNGRVFVARVLARPANPQVIDPIDAANLIATAPEMLAALELVRDQDLIPAETPNGFAAREVISTTINKARGAA